MIHDINGLKIKTLGDPHLGRPFLTGVPLHRRGEREQQVMEQFRKDLLDVKGVDMHVCMGDLFDKMVVPPSVVLFAAAAYLKAARENPEVYYVVLMGNHDGSRDTMMRSSFDLFDAIVNPVGNILVVRDHARHLQRGLCFVPWHPFKSAKEMVAEAPPAEVYFGHWDIESFGGDDHQLLPYEELSKRTKLVITGHVHGAREFEHDDLKVIVTGSMQPYSHGEDPAGERYVTLTLAQLEQAGDLADKCVRLILADGEEMPAEIPDCLQFTVKRISTEAPEAVEVQLESFSLQKLFKEAMAEEGFLETSTIYLEVWTRISELHGASSEV